MSKNALILEKSAAFKPAAPEPNKPAARTGEFTDLTRRLFRGRAAIAVIGAGQHARADEACRGIAAELAATGSRVVIVQLCELQRTTPVAGETGFLPGRVPNVCTWPAPAARSVDLFPMAPAAVVGEDWLSSLRAQFDAVLLDGTNCGDVAAISELAAAVDSVLLVAGTGATVKREIQNCQRLLELRGARLAGCILMQRR